MNKFLITGLLTLLPLLSQAHIVCKPMNSEDLDYASDFYEVSIATTQGIPTKISVFRFSAVESPNDISVKEQNQFLFDKLQFENQVELRKSQVKVAKANFAGRLKWQSKKQSDYTSRMLFQGKTISVHVFSTDANFKTAKLAITDLSTDLEQAETLVLTDDLNCKTYPEKVEANNHLLSENDGDTN